MQYCELDLSGQWLDTVYCEENFSDLVFVKFLNPSKFEEKIYCYTLHITKRTPENKRLLLYYEDEFKKYGHDVSELVGHGIILRSCWNPRQ
ncbi:YOL159C-A-like protein [Saccharomyces cerevisiae JAY291]|uniref:YOL159C-A-like protein n=1 Tax=Saccharomyces cerevisiae (strain JAY291) TaxID=574961 RepID=C7GV27_YEAS2|nr:YOL159C-A-like protein [Saccharomyces cerevisiae JAY291]